MIILSFTVNTSATFLQVQALEPCTKSCTFICMLQWYFCIATTAQT